MMMMMKMMMIVIPEVKLNEVTFKLGSK